MKKRCGGWLAAALTLLCGCVQAQAPGPAVVAPPEAPVAAALDPVDLAAYVDGVVAAYRRRLGIEGVVVAVVDRDKPLLLRGYGLAGHQPARAADPADTLFRIGSVSKTFTYLEALRLVEAGKLKLDAPVNDYLPPALHLPEDGYGPVLLRHLFTHTAGFEDSALGHLFAATPETAVSLQDYLAAHRPARVREPGGHAVYSNYSVALLGAVIAQVEGGVYENLIERDLLQPLGMASSTFREPLAAADPRRSPESLRPRWSSGFDYAAGGFTPQPFEYIAQVAPAGAMSATAADMERFLRLLLNRGELDGQRILPAAVFDRLERDPLVRNAPDATGFAYGFFRRRYGEVVSVEHGGATLYFHSNLVAVPELGFGVFVSTNTGTGRRLAAELPQLLIERYFAKARPPALPAPPADFAERGREYAGTYLGERRNYRGFEKLLVSSNVQIGQSADGYLTLSNGEDTTRWVWEKADVFRALQGSDRLAFLRDGGGAVSGFVAPGGHDVFDRVGLFGNKNLAFPLIALAALSAAGVLFGLWQRRRAAGAAPAIYAARWLGLAAVAWLVFALLFGLSLAQLGDEAVAIFHYPSGLLRLTLWLTPLLLLLSAGQLLQLRRAWAAPDWSRWRKLRHTAAVAVFLLAGAVLWQWNALGWAV